MPPRTPSTLSNNAAKWLDKSTKIIDAATKALQKYSGAPQSLETPVVRRRHSLGPIGDALRDAGAVTISSRHELARGLVTNPELCDQTLKLLGPSLQPYMGCNIIDLHPGPGVWSSKVHDLLKPRSHLLVESDKKTFYPFLEPLLTKPLSTYRFVHRHLKTTGLGALNNKAEEAEDLLSYPLEPRRGSNDCLDVGTLVLATITTIPIGVKRAGAVESSSSEPFLYSYLTSLLERTGFHSSGLVRMLIWMPETDKYSAQPRSVNGRSSHSPRLEDVAQITEIVGSAVTPFNKRRSRNEVCSAVHVARKMNEDGITLPAGRASALHQAALDSFDNTHIDDDFDKSSLIVNGQHLPRTSSLVRKIDLLESLEKRFAENRFKRHMPKDDQADKRLLVETPEYSQMTALAAEIDALVPSLTKPWSNPRIDALLVQEEELFRLELDSTDASLSQTERFLAEGVAETLADDLRTARSRLTEREARALATNVDNWLALRNSPALMSWDRRPFEPLAAHPEDFYPRLNLALLDITPHATRTLQGVDFPFLASHPLVRSLRSFRLATISEALEKMVYGAADALLTPKKCPTLFDPNKGGRIYVENVRVRMLTPAMLIELCAAWDDWPFRASEEQLKFTFNLAR